MISVPKRKVTKVLIVVFLVLSIVAPIIMNLFTNNKVDNSTMIANSYTMDAVIDEYGDMHVTEKINIYNMANDNNYFYREIAYNKNNMFGHSYFNNSDLSGDVRFTAEENGSVVYDSSVSSFNSYPYHFAGFSYRGDKDERGETIKCETQTTDCVMAFYYHESGFAKKVIFTYEYTIKGVITEYSDVSELNWVLLDYQPIKVSNIVINITLPSGDYDIKDMNTFFHGSGVAKREFVASNKIRITADSMISNEQIEARLLLDKDVFSSVRAKNKVHINALDDILLFEKNQERVANLKYYIGYVGSFLIFGLFVVILLLVTILCYKKYDKEFETSFMNEYHMELPREYAPAIMSYLFKFREIDDDDLCATLLDLIRRKYLILDDNNSGLNDNNPNYIIRLNEKMDQSDLLEYEKFLIKWFIKDIGDGKEVSANRMYSYCDTISGAEKYHQDSVKWYSLVADEGKRYDFFDKSIKNAKGKYTAIGATLMLIVSGILGLLYLFGKYNLSTSLIISFALLCLAFITYVSSFDRRSREGNEDFVRWKAFKKFLTDFSNLKDYPVTSIIVWEHYLVYATSFGIADKVMEQLKLTLDLNEISKDSTTLVFFGYHHPITCFNSSIRTMKSTYNATMVKAEAQRSGGGSGSHGGFSGGSSFGGGGGSFGGGHR